MRVLQPACTFPISEGMEVQTDSPKVRAARKFVLELLLSDHPNDCMTCEMCGHCEFQDLIYEYGVKETPFVGERHLFPRMSAIPSSCGTWRSASAAAAASAPAMRSRRSTPSP